MGTRDIANAVSVMTGKKIQVLEQASNGDLPVDGGGGPVTGAVARLAGRPATGLNAVLEANRKQIVESPQAQAK